MKIEKTIIDNSQKIAHINYSKKDKEIIYKKYDDEIKQYEKSLKKYKNTKNI